MINKVKGMLISDEEYCRQFKRLNETELQMFWMVEHVMRFSRKGGLQYVVFGEGREITPGSELPKNKERAFEWMYARLTEYEDEGRVLTGTTEEQDPVRPLPYCLSYMLVEIAWQLPEVVQRQGGSTAEDRIIEAFKALGVKPELA